MPKYLLRHIIVTIMLVLASPAAFISETIAAEPMAAETRVAGTKADIKLESTTPAQAQKTKAPGKEVEKPRGQLLYENHCGECHESSVHNRAKRKADSINKIRFWVTKWSGELKLNWSPADIEEVTKHVNNKYYHFKK